MGGGPPGSGNLCGVLWRGGSRLAHPDVREIFHLEIGFPVREFIPKQPFSQKSREKFFAQKQGHLTIQDVVHYRKYRMYSAF